MSSLSAENIEKILVPWMNRFARRMNTYLDGASNDQIIALRNAIKPSLRFMGDGVEVRTAMLFLFKHLNAVIDGDYGNLTDNQLVAAKALQRTNQLMLTNADLISIASANGSFYDLFLKMAPTSVGIDRLTNIALWIPKDIESYNQRIDDFRQSRLYQNLDRPLGSDRSSWELWIYRVLSTEK